MSVRENGIGNRDNHSANSHLCPRTKSGATSSNLFNVFAVVLIDVIMTNQTQLDMIDSLIDQSNSFYGFDFT